MWKVSMRRSSRGGILADTAEILRFFATLSSVSMLSLQERGILDCREFQIPSPSLLSGEYGENNCRPPGAILWQRMVSSTPSTTWLGAVEEEPTGNFDEQHPTSNWSTQISTSNIPNIKDNIWNTKYTNWNTKYNIPNTKLSTFLIHLFMWGR